MRVLCLNDKNLPLGAEIVSGDEYEVDGVEYDTFGTKLYTIKGIKNQGLTDKGLNWYGYAAHRFAIMSDEAVSIEMEEAMPVLN